MHKPIVIASRRSPLAVAQALAVRSLLGRAAGIPEEEWEERFPHQTFVTIGDRNLQDSLSEVGGKGLFVKEIEAALLSGEADIAVHSMKDMPAEMPPGLVQAAVPEREDPRDAFVTLSGMALGDLPRGAVVGTSSIRRAAQLRRQRPDLEVVPFRGNVQTRLQKLEDGEASGTFLAEAGLRRLERSDVKRSPIDPSDMLPALGQGVLCIQTRDEDSEAYRLCRDITCPSTELTSAAERAFVARLEGSCRTPMAGLATLEGGDIRFRAEVLHPDGSETAGRDERFSPQGASPAGKVADAALFGRALAERLLAETSDALRRVIAEG